MDTLKTAFFGVILPGLVSLVLFAVAWYKCQKREETQSRTWAGAIAVGAAFWAGYVLLFGIPPYPPTETTMWIPWIVVSVAVFGLVDGILKLPYALVWFIRLALSMGFTWQLLHPMLRQQWTSEEGTRWVGWLSVAIVAIWGFVDETAWRVRGAGMPIALGLAAAALSLALFWGSNTVLAQIALILAATTAGAIYPGIWRPVLSLATGAIPVYVLAYYSLLIAGHIYAGLPIYSAVAFALAPLGPSCAMVKGFREDRKWQTTTAVICALIPALIGLYFAYGAKLSTPG